MVNRRLLRWGVFLLGLGGVLLLGQAGGLDRELVRQALGLWPLAIIAVGAAILLRRTPAALPSGVIAAALPGLLLGGLIISIPDVGAACRTDTPSGFDTRQGTFDGSAEVDLVVACGDLQVRTVSGSGWEARIGQSALPPSVDAGPERLRIATASRRVWLGTTSDGDSVDLALPTSTLLDLTAEIDAGEGRLDLRGAQLGQASLVVNAGKASLDLGGATLRRLQAEVNAGGADIRLPAAEFDGTIEVNFGQVRICVPSDLGLLVRNDVSFGSMERAGFRRDRSGSAWESPGYQLAPHHAELDVDVHVGSVEFNPQGGCR